MRIWYFASFSTLNGADLENSVENVNSDGAVIPTREDLVAMVEKDVAFSSPQNRIELFNLIRKLTCDEPSDQ